VHLEVFTGQAAYYPSEFGTSGGLRIVIILWLKNLMFRVSRLVRSFLVNNFSFTPINPDILADKMSCKSLDFSTPFEELVSQIKVSAIPGYPV
jgi:hypothetical protein